MLSENSANPEGLLWLFPNFALALAEALEIKRAMLSLVNIGLHSTLAFPARPFRAIPCHLLLSLFPGIDPLTQDEAVDTQAWIPRPDQETRQLKRPDMAVTPRLFNDLHLTICVIYLPI